MMITVPVPTQSDRASMIGDAERNLKMLREVLGIRIAARDQTIRIEGDDRGIQVARVVLEQLREAATDHRRLTRDQVLEMITEQIRRADNPQARGTPRTGPAWTDELDVYAGGSRVRPKTENQQAYLDAIRDLDLVFGIGPAGTGKTYLAVAAAVHMLKHGRVNRLMLVRPAVEAGEKLGFLPGDLEAKVNPYLRPLLDALHDMMDYSTIRRFIDSDVIEIVPLAYMRGRTLNNSVIILDEAQNTTRGQMKMFLTRMGHGSKMIVTGDSTQIDLPDPLQSGLVDAARRLQRVKGVGFLTLTGEDVVRHKLVQRIVSAYGEENRDTVHAQHMRQALAGEPETNQ
jgi:phosphate starvation-inducible protein PhoH and related proteins